MTGVQTCALPISKVTGFPSNEKSPSHYISRYNSEPQYKIWFDNNFPGQTIYDVLGFPNPASIPSWIKSNADWWSTGLIEDKEFVAGIEYMIQNRIIVIPNLPTSQVTADPGIPDWVRNNANWWANNFITDNDFVKGIEYLIEVGIIRV